MPMRFCLKVTALGWRFEVQSNAGPSRSPSSPPSPSTLPSAIPSTSGTSRNNRSTMADREESAASALSLSPSEKTTKKPRNYLSIGAAIVRVWQFGSSVFVYVSMVSLFVYIRHTRNFNAPLEYVHESGLVSLVYSTVTVTSVFAFRRWKKLPGWSVFAWSTFAGDLMMMGLAVTKITLLSQAGVPRDCRGLMPPDKSSFAYSNAFLTQNTWSPSDDFEDTELSFVDFCLLPRTVYGFCVAAIFSHTLSILLTVFQLQRYFRSLETAERPSYPGHVEIVVPPHIASRATPPPRPTPRAAPPARPHPPSILRNPHPPLPPRPSTASSVASSTGTAPPSYHSSPSLTNSSTYTPNTTFSSISTSSNQTQYTAASSAACPSASGPSGTVSAPCSTVGRPHSLPVQDDPNKYANMPPMEIVTYNPRVSEETTSTDPELYLVADGFRPEEPPEYSSRPSSLYNGRNMP